MSFLPEIFSTDKQKARFQLHALSLCVVQACFPMLLPRHTTVFAIAPFISDICP